MNYSEYRRKIEEIHSLYRSISKLNDGESVISDGVRYIRDKYGRFTSRSMSIYDWLKYLFYESKDKEVLKDLALSVFRSQIVISGKGKSGVFFGIYSETWQTKKEKKGIFKEADEYAAEYASVFGSSIRKPNEYNLYYSGYSLKSIKNDVEIIENPLSIMFNYESSLFYTKFHPMTGIDYFGQGKEFGLNSQAFDYLLHEHIIPIITKNYKGRIKDMETFNRQSGEEYIDDDIYAEIFGAK